jgi:hypothetical protein
VLISHLADTFFKDKEKNLINFFSPSELLKKHFARKNEQGERKEKLCNFVLKEFCRKINRVFHVWSMIISSKYITWIPVCSRIKCYLKSNKKTEKRKREGKKRSSFEECARVLCADKAYFSRMKKRQTAQKRY